MINLTQNK